MRRILPSATTLALLAAACTSGDPAASAITVRDSAGIAIVENDLTRLDARCTIGATPTVSIGVEEGEEPYMLAQLGGAVRTRDGRIVIANRATDELRWFDAAGKYLRASGRKGEGPGEFREPFVLHLLPGDTVYSGDFRPFRFLVFAPDGGWVRTIDLSPMYINTPRSMHILDDGRMVLGIEETPPRRGRTFTASRFALVMYDAAGVRGDTIAVIENGRWGQTVDDPGSVFVYPIFESFGVAAAGGDRIITGHASRTELKVQRAESGYPVERLVRWTIGHLDVTPEDVAAEKERLARPYENRPPEFRKQYLDPLINDARPVAERFPAFGRLRMGRDGLMWIREFPRPRDATGQHHWIAFDADGRFTCRLDTPRFDDIYEFGAGHLLAEVRDSLGVEMVQQYALTRP